MKKRNLLAGTVLCLAMVFSAAGPLYSDILAAETGAEDAAVDPGFVAELDSAVDLSSAVEVRIEDGKLHGNAGGKSLILAELKQHGVKYEDDVLKIGKAGTFVISGSLEGQLKVSTDDGGDVVLVFDGFTVTNENDEAVVVKKTDSLVIYLNEGSENVITSGIETEITAKEDTSSDAQDNYYRMQEAAPDAGESAPGEAADGESAPRENADGESAPDEAADATGMIEDQTVSDETAAEEEPTGSALHVKTDTVIKGSGSLVINGYINNGLGSSKNLTIDSGSLDIKALNNGIKAKDTLIINGGDINVFSGNDGIKANTDAQEAAEEVLDENGTIIAPAAEAVEAAGVVIINGGNVNVNSFGDGIQGTLDLTVNGGNININGAGEFVRKSGESGGESGGSQTSSLSRKGIKSDGTLSVNNGTIYVETSDDALHAAETISINGGSITIITGDDGIHSDTQLDINDGDIFILDAYEGIEANQINVNGGNVSVGASDDGFNANGGSMSGGGPGDSNGNESRTATDLPVLTISGGNVYVNSSGDGLDSNGSLIITGGVSIVDGPESSFNGALDSGTENGGEIKVSGGTVFAWGASGMDESFDSTSAQPSFRLTFTSTYRAGTLITIKTSDGTELFSHEVASSGNSLVFSCPDLVIGDTYTVTVGEYDFELTPSNTVSNFRGSVSNGVPSVEVGNSGGSGGGPGGGPGGGQDGARPEGDSNGERPEGESEGQRPEGESNGERAEGESDGQRPEGESDGQRPEGESQGRQQGEWQEGQSGIDPNGQPGGPGGQGGQPGMDPNGQPGDPGGQGGQPGMDPNGQPGGPGGQGGQPGMDPNGQPEGQQETSPDAI